MISLFQPREFLQPNLKCWKRKELTGKGTKIDGINQHGYEKMRDIRLKTYEEKSFKQNLK